MVISGHIFLTTAMQICIIDFSQPIIMPDFQFCLFAVCEVNVCDHCQIAGKSNILKIVFLICLTNIKIES